MSDNNSGEFLIDLKKNFVSERQDILLAIQGIENEIEHTKELIVSLNNKEDADYSLFSPRAGVKLYESQIKDKEKEIESLEEELRLQYKKLSNVTKQLDSLKNVKASDVTSSVVSMTEADSVAVDTSVVTKEVDNMFDHDFEGSLNMILKTLNDLESNDQLASQFIVNDPVRAQQMLQTNLRIIEQSRGKIVELIKQFNQ
ncbi:MAG: hypothetical protein K6E19_09060 [Lachnospiraceae bacterium]|nr:hypothetical protein [Lachnospiraceae bacterium]